MNTVSTIVDAQLQHLLKIVDQYREQRCRELLEQARSQAQQLLRQAHSDARTRAHKDLTELREQIRSQFASADARKQTLARRENQKTDRVLLQGTWQILQDALLQRWQQTEARQQWIEAVIQTAGYALLDPHWLIEHPADMAPQEQAALQVKLMDAGRADSVCQPQAAISAGLRISSGGACTDGTIQGLLHNRARIESLLLARIHTWRRNGV